MPLESNTEQPPEAEIDMANIRDRLHSLQAATFAKSFLILCGSAGLLFAGNYLFGKIDDAPFSQPNDNRMMALLVPTSMFGGLALFCAHLFHSTKQQERIEREFMEAYDKTRGVVDEEDAWEKWKAEFNREGALRKFRGGIPVPPDSWYWKEEVLKVHPLD